ncbi:related to Nap1p-binding protein [Claviceps purpurea 20.1]|uniref:Related to Nap1p-binding protein n=1 Tax=Claviceps purpurea (strain 20.1) TaxID=1111077 RepID=M1VZQ2_CLAP2|nr:hypothetical protein E4U28_003885 [Claviceps purpurea]CCE35168.1 related to Nap1p-binding protein [Claviceps purpurea 20.1]KAG6152566.1 hypothetical protein E4U37_003777 [Claviceps purpurea]KAG6154096.1 hypothetical protein E4U11_006626 [Claviceps purpurea]KAG6181353.1 hypothetical protein E4U36_004147 [Claviceps purpurea]
MTDASSSGTSPSQESFPSQNPSHAALPSLTTSTPSRPSTLPRPTSHASMSRLSQYSVASIPSRSRPGSHLFPAFPSSLPYTIVRDFAYPCAHPLHYGPPSEPSGPPSGLTTPASETRRLSDPPASWEQRMPWDSWNSDGFHGGDILPIQMGDGPPYSEDEDLQSPVVATRHRKHKSSSAALCQARGKAVRDGNMLGMSGHDGEKEYFVGASVDGSERYYVPHGDEAANGPGGDYVTYAPDEVPSRGYHYSQQPQLDHYGQDDSSPISSPGYQEADESRYSRDYQFTITSPDEEFHGKAVALFDFERENENELPLVEGQIIWVSYRHGQGWLVAEDPKTQESGLVPEEYVRLLRDIEGGMNSLTGTLVDGCQLSNEAEPPVQAEHGRKERQVSTISTNGYHQPVLSVFSTSSKDLNPYPTEQLGIQAGQTPPQVVHYHGQRGGSQTNAPTIGPSHEPGTLRNGSRSSNTIGEAAYIPPPECYNPANTKTAATR